MEAQRSTAVCRRCAACAIERVAHIEHSCGQSRHCVSCKTVARRFMIYTVTQRCCSRQFRLFFPITKNHFLHSLFLLFNDSCLELLLVKFCLSLSSHSSAFPHCLVSAEGHGSRARSFNYRVIPESNLFPSFHPVDATCYFAEPANPADDLPKLVSRRADARGGRDCFGACVSLQVSDAPGPQTGSPAGPDAFRVGGKWPY